ncbi:MAG: flagellar motor protein MotB [Treponema sp.]|jgi:chemotaxis protein MotB|nr:flagellar motor protein MotB [Treponema sp.]
MARKKKQEEPIPSTWLNTYADMITLCLCFFVIMFNPDDVTQAQLDAISTSIQQGGLGALPGGLTLASGVSAELGSTIMSLPSMEKGRSLGTSLRKAVSVFSPEIRSNKVRITHDERGVVITLASDAFFNPASARINIEATRDILLRLGSYLASQDVEGRKFRIEGHTDSVDVDPSGPWESNWELSAARSISILHYLSDLGIDERRFQIAGFADTVPIASNSSPEGRAYNRRVDIIILDEAHL